MNDRNVMNGNPAATLSATDVGVRAALIFALVTERLTVFYEEGQWLTEAQGATLMAEWLARTKRSLPVSDRRRLSDLADQLARQMTAALSREAGLYTAHEMSEALAPNYHSDLAQSMMVECERLLKDS